LLRQRHRFENRRVLVIDCPDPSSVSMLIDAVPGAEWSFLLRDFAVYRAARGKNAATVSLGFDLLPAATACPTACVIIYMPREKEVLEMTLHLLAGQLKEPAQVVVVGANRSGVTSARSVLERHGGAARKSDAARHCSLIEGTLNPVPDRASSAADFEKHWAYDTGSGTLDIVSLPGVFSHGHLDDGTACLLQSIELPDGGRCLDVGAGAGVVGAAVAVRRPKMAVTMIEAHAAALYASRRTVAANALTNVEVLPSDYFSDVDGEFNVIACNPPFHRGGETSYRAIDRLIAGSTAHLGAGGTLWLVANSFLPYQERLARAFGDVKAVYDDRSYRVYRCSGPLDAARAEETA
jgi:16S rRNA (guanine1207-N2)-methyltransferase